MLHTIIATALLVSAALAQTSTTCNPLNSTCPTDAALGTTFYTTFNSSMTQMNPDYFNVTAGASLISFSNNGAALALQKKGDSVTVQTAFYIMFGRMEIVFQAAAGAGIISTGILISDDLDEIDWEIIGSHDTNVSNNWYGHGNTAQINSEYPSFDGATDGFHNYTVDWNSDRIEWILDGTLMRTVAYNVSGQYPQTPSFVRFGIWSGGDSPSAGTVAWAGGATDWSKAPYVMTVQSLKVVDGTQNSSTYTYGDQTGSWSSIKTTTGQSQAYKYIHQLSSSQQALASWNGLSTAAKIGIAAGVLGGLAISMIAFCTYCMLQRKKGREERKLADREWEQHEAELLEYKRQMQKGGFAVSSADYYGQQQSPRKF